MALFASLSALFILSINDSILSSNAYAPNPLRINRQAIVSWGRLEFGRSSSVPDRATMTTLFMSSKSDNDAEVDAKEDKEIPCLPMIGQSSFSGISSEDSDVIRLDGTKKGVDLVGRETFELQYTCKICETRNSHKVHRMGEWFCPCNF